jgi:DNA-directed RNA polymerase specialized sigma24 family protein
VNCRWPIMTCRLRPRLGIEPGTVRMHLSRGLAALRHELTLANATEVGQ